MLTMSFPMCLLHCTCLRLSLKIYQTFAETAIINCMYNSYVLNLVINNVTGNRIAWSRCCFSWASTLPRRTTAISSFVSDRLVLFEIFRRRWHGDPTAEWDSLKGDWNVALIKKVADGASLMHVFWLKNFALTLMPLTTYCFLLNRRKKVKN